MEADTAAVGAVPAGRLSPAMGAGPARVLVAYASADGSTEGVAERIAARLSEHGHHVVVAPVDRRQAVEGFDAVVVGSAVHARQWLDEATDFVHAHRAALTQRPFWTFSVGMPDSLPGFLRRLARTEEDGIVAQLGELRPQGHRIFSGVVSPGQFPFSSRVFLRLAGVRYGDYRDWDAIEGWADEIAGALENVVTLGPGD
jgi:menaquinone-dependent protoporphyrinogen oxidase